MSFVHLHTHSEFSLLDGLGKTKELIARAKEMEQPALALTDHGAMHGMIQFYINARKAGIKPILGMEGYLSRRKLTDKDPLKDRDPFHILLLAKNYQGYRNLIQLSTISQLKGFYYKPRIDKEVLQKYREGLISSTGCINGEIPQALLNGQENRAYDLTKEYLDIFGPENFFVELQRHQLNKPDGFLYTNLEKLNQGLIKLAKNFNLPLVATNDVHYVNAEDAEAQDALLAIQTKELMNSPDRKLSMIDSPDFYLKTTAEMQELFPGLPESIENSLKIADLVDDDYKIPMGHMIFPKFDTPDGTTTDEFLRKITYEKVQGKYPQVTSEVTERIEKELQIISDKGYSSYILIFEDLARFCKNEDIIVTARGSAVGSIVNYIHDIGFLDPLYYNIPFERWLNPERDTPPDIDLDMEDIARDKIIDYTVQKYGQDRVARVVTFGSMEARAAARDIGRVMGMPYTFVDKIAKLILPPKQGFSVSVEESIEQVAELKEMYTSNPEVRKLLDMAKRVQGVKRHAGTHAAAVIVADKPITEYVPLMEDRKEGKPMTQYDMYSLDLNAVSDALGLVKMDYLGLRNLTILNQALHLVEKYQGVKIQLKDIPTDEPKVFEMLSEGDNTGVFQMESGGFRQVSRDLKPNRVEDLMVLVALYRPGPMEMIPSYIDGKHNPDKVQYLHPALKQVLGDTYGVLVYQEQCMEIAQVMAGYTLGRGDLLRRAIGKKSKEYMAKEKESFVKGAAEQGYSKKEATAVFGFIEKFAAYGFNRAHSASYGMIAYQTAYLKAMYPVEFFAALLSCERHNTEKVAFVVSEIRQKGMKILGPDINKSGIDFEVEEGEERSIRYALSAIKNVGEGSIEAIVAERNANGPFKDFLDFCLRVDTQNTNRKVMESLIYAGAFQNFGTKSSLLRILPEYVEAAGSYQKMKKIGQNSLFGLDQTIKVPSVSRMTAIEEAPEEQILQWERDVMGFYFTKHPFEKKLSKLREVLEAGIGELTEDLFGKDVVIGGVVTNKHVVLTKKDQREMCFLELTDMSGKLEVIVFPDTYQNGVRKVANESLLIVQGKLDQADDGTLKVVARKLLLPNNI
jgi:DNA polymerase-3 subunit alpha